MPNKLIDIGDLVSIKKKLQKLIALPDWGIVIQATTIIAADIPEDEEFDPIDAFLVFFPATDETLTIPANCLKKILMVTE